MDKIERLLSVMNVLLGAPTPLSADAIRRRVPGYPDEEASWKRAFERDKDELRDMGVPLLVETIPGSDPPLLGYRIRQRDYELRDPGLEPDELEALNLAAAVTGLAGGLGQRAIFKLGGGAADAPEAELPADPNLVAAFSGVAERRELTFGYHGVERSVHPYRLEFVRGRWYLNGFDATRGDDRWFRLDRVEGDVVPGAQAGAFERPAEAVPGLQLDPWAVGGSEDPVDAEVWFDPGVAHTVLRHLDPEAVVSSDDDGLVVRVRVTNREGFRDWVVSFLERAEVRSPAELRDLVVGWLEGVVAAGAGAAGSGDGDGGER